IVANRVTDRVGIAAPAQLGGDPDGSGDVANRYRLRAGEDLRRVGERAVAQFLVDQPRVLRVKEREGADAQDGEEREPDEQHPAHRSQKEPRQPCAPGTRTFISFLGTKYDFRMATREAPTGIAREAAVGDPNPFRLRSLCYLPDGAGWIGPDLLILWRPAAIPQPSTAQ